MKRIFNTVGNIIGLAVVVGIGIILVLTLKQTNPQNEQVSTFQSPIEKVVPIPTVTSAPVQFSSPIKPAEPYVLQLCTFDTKTSVEEPASESLLNSYVFSEPKPILDFEIGLNIFQWLPDSQRLLIRRLGKESPTSVDVFNVYTSRLETYTKQSFAGTDGSVWLDAEQAVAFTDIASDGQYVLYIAYKDGEIKQVSTDLGSMHLSVPPDGKQVTFVSTKNYAKPENYNISADKNEPIPFPTFELPQDRDGKYPLKTIKTKWHPDGERLAYYDDVFYLVDIKESSACTLDLGEYNGLPLHADWVQWSPDGRFLAILEGEPNFQFIGLFVIDTFTGERKEIDVAGGGDKYAVTWSPTSRDLLVAAQSLDEDDRYNLYLVDVMTGKSRQILKEYSFWYNAYSGIQWSPDGEMIALECPSFDGKKDPKQLCLIEVKVQ